MCVCVFVSAFVNCLSKMAFMIFLNILGPGYFGMKNLLIYLLSPRKFIFVQTFHNYHSAMNHSRTATMSLGFCHEGYVQK